MADGDEFAAFVRKFEEGSRHLYGFDAFGARENDMEQRVAMGGSERAFRLTSVRAEVEPVE